MKRFPPTRLRPLRLPIVAFAGLRIAELSARPMFQGASPFPALRWCDLKAYAPHVLAAAAAELHRLVERLDLRTLEAFSIDRAIFAVTELGDKPLSDTMRIVLWQRFGVPVYELYIGPERTLLARECEAQEGWHVEPGVEFVHEAGQLALSAADGFFPTGLPHGLEEALCACGRPGARIVKLRTAVHHGTESLLAAFA